MAVILLRMALITGVSVAVGLGYSLGLRQLPLVPSEEVVQEEQQEREELSDVKQREREILDRAGIDAARLMELADQGALVIDARPPEQFDEARLAAPFIVNIEPQDVAPYTDDLFTLVYNEPPVPIVIYCESETCDSSKLVYTKINQLVFGTDHGVEQLYIYAPGWEGIERDGLPTTSDFPADPALVIQDVISHALMSGQGYDPALEDDPGLMEGEFDDAP